MRILLAAGLAALLPISVVGPGSINARAQGIVATPLPPPDSQAEPEQTPPAMGRPGGFPDVWQPRQGATIQALDKINARHAELPLRLGVPVRFHALTIMLKACVVRPPDQPADAAALVSVTEDGAEGAPFGGWLIRSAPAASMMQHPVYDLRVIGCLP